MRKRLQFELFEPAPSHALRDMLILSVLVWVFVLLHKL